VQSGPYVIKDFFLQNGEIKKFGDIQQAVDLYLSSNNNNDGEFKIGKQGKDEIVIFEEVRLKNKYDKQTQNFEFGDSLTVEIHCFSDKAIELPYFWIGIESQYGSLFAANSLIDGIRPNMVNGKFVISCTFKNLKLLPQTYVINAGARMKSGTELLTRSKEVGSFTVISKLDEIGFVGELAESFAPNASPLFIPYSWSFNNEKKIEVNF